MRRHEFRRLSRIYAITGTGHAVNGHEFRGVICLAMHSSFHILTCVLMRWFGTTHCSCVDCMCFADYRVSCNNCHGSNDEFSWLLSRVMRLLDTSWEVCDGSCEYWAWLSRSCDDWTWVLNRFMRLLYMTVTGHAMTRNKFQILSRLDDWRWLLRVMAWQSEFWWLSRVMRWLGMRSEDCHGSCDHRTSLWSMNCDLWSLKYDRAVWTMKYEVWNINYEVWTAKCEVWTMKCENWSMKSELWSVNCKVRSVDYEMWTLNKKQLTVTFEVLSLNYGKQNVHFRFILHISYFTIHTSQFMVHTSDFTFQSSNFTVKTS